MGYSIERLDGNIIKFNMYDTFTAEDASSHAREMDPILAELGRKNEQAMFLIYTSKLKKISIEGRRSFSERNGDERIGKTAVVGVNRFLKVIARFIIVASGKDNIRFFDEVNEADALAWLRE